MSHDRSLRKITLVVVLLHFSLIYWGSMQPTWLPQKNLMPKQQLIVRTIPLEPKAPPSPVPAPPPPLPEPEPVLIAAVEPAPLPEAIPEPEPVPIPLPEPEIAAVKAYHTHEEELKPEKIEPEVKPEPKKEAAKSKVTTKPKQAAKAKPKPKPKTKPQPKKAETKPKKPEPKKAAPKVEPKKTVPKAEPKKETKPQPDAKQKQLLAKAQESISKIDKSHAKVGKEKSVEGPRKIENLQIDTLSSESLTTDEIGYRDELARRLKRTLKLPDVGAVKLKLTLTKAGKVVKVVVVKSESSRNQNYLESSLPSLSFPGFGSHFGGVGQYTFLLTLTNE